MTTTNDQELEQFLDRAAVAEWLGTSERHLRRLVELHGMPVHRVGRKQRFRRSEVLDWLHGDGRRR